MCLLVLLSFTHCVAISLFVSTHMNNVNRLKKQREQWIHQCEQRYQQHEQTNNNANEELSNMNRGFESFDKYKDFILKWCKIRKHILYLSKN